MTTSAFTDSERDYVRGKRRLARIATVGADGTPHVTPVGFTHNTDLGTIDVGGLDLTATKKFRDVQRGGRAAIVIDDLASVDPWPPRGVECGVQPRRSRSPHRSSASTPSASCPGASGADKQRQGEPSLPDPRQGGESEMGKERCGLVGGARHRQEGGPHQQRAFSRWARPRDDLPMPVGPRVCGCFDEVADHVAGVLVAPHEGELGWRDPRHGHGDDSLALVDGGVAFGDEGDAEAVGDCFERLVGVVGDRADHGLGAISLGCCEPVVAPRTGLGGEGHERLVSELGEAHSSAACETVAGGEGDQAAFGGDDLPAEHAAVGDG